MRRLTRTYNVLFDAFPSKLSFPGLLLTMVLLQHIAWGAVHYVDVKGTNPVPPYASWETAAVVIQDAVDAAAVLDEVVVAAGWYATGGRYVGSSSNRVAVTKALTVRSFAGPGTTIIEGFQAEQTTNNVRCVYLADRTALIGFTLTNGTGGVGGKSSSAWVSNCVIGGNVSPGASGVTVLDSILVGNSNLRGGAEGGGAAGCIMTNCNIIGNSISYRGGGVVGSILSRCLLFGNTSSGYGGGASFSALYNCTLDSNSALEGGGSYYSGLTNCLVISNSAWYGGGSLGGGTQSAVLQQCTFIGNSAQNGGGVESAYLIDCVLSNNTAMYGGAIFQCQATNCVLVANQATGGGGAYFGTLQNCRIMFNSAGVGGGIARAVSMGCAILTNSATAAGGGAADVSINNCVLVGNRANLGGGMARYYEVQSVANNCTIVANTATNTGGGTYEGDLFNSIIYYNSAPTDPNITAGTNIAYCCTVPLTATAVSSIAAPPGFVDLATGNLALQPGSPCIDAGSNLYSTNNADAAGQPRISGGTVDIGAYEFQALSPFQSWLGRFGLPTNGSADYVDSDADGLNNWQEWVAGTNPTNAASVLRIESATLALPNPGLAIRWLSVTNRFYFLERSTNLVQSGSFVVIQTNIPGQDGVTTFIHTNAVRAAPAWYRVGVSE